MAYFAIAFIAPNYRDYSNQWLKAYEPGTTTPKSMALDSAAAVTVAKLQLNADGFLKSAGDALVIPYIEGAYDLWLFPTSAEADANDTSSAVRVADDINSTNLSLINDPSQAYEFPTVAAYKASTIVFPVGKIINLLDRGASFTVIAGTGTANIYSIIDSTQVSQSISIILRDEMSLKNFGGISSAGEDLVNSANNSAALVHAVNLNSGPINSTASTTSKTATITLSGEQWTFDDVDLRDRWGWQVDCKNSRMYINGNWLLDGCAFFDLKLGYCEPVASKISTQSFISMVRSAVGNERTHNFYISFKLMSAFLNAFNCQDNWSQGVIQGGQLNGNIKCITSSGGGENVVLKDWIFAGHVTNTSEIVLLTNSNAICENFQFETLPDNDRNDIRLVNCFNVKFPGLLMTTSGGIRIEGGFGSIQGATISNSVATTVINHISGPEWQIDGNGIRWDVNNGTGTSFTDGTGKVGIATSTGMATCAGNKIRRADTGIKSTGTAPQSYDANTILDPKTNAFLLQAADNCSINDGVISLDNGTAKGVTVTSTNGSGNKVNNVSWGASPTADRYNISSGNGQNLIVVDGGVGNPESLGIKAGTGSMWSDNGGAVGSSIYQKGLFGTGSDNWNPIGIASRTAAQLGAATDFINVTGKHSARQCKNATTSQILYALGTGATDAWLDADGSVVITPV